MKPTPNRFLNWRRKISSKWGLWLVISFTLIVFILAAQIGEGEFSPLLALVEGALGGFFVLVLGFWIKRMCLWLFCWKNSKRLVIWLGGFFLLLLLIRLEENWRGKRAWENFRHEWEAKGEKFDIKTFIPPPVPDEQNFAMTPVVASCYEFILDKEGHRIQPAKTNVVDRLNFNTFSTNYYSENTPTNGDWQIGTLTDLKTWQEYYRNALCTNENGSVTHEFPFVEQQQSSGKDILLALTQYDGALKELAEASRLPASRFPLNYDNEMPAAIILPHLSAMKKSALLLQMRALAELETGESSKACADTLLIFHLTEKIRDEPFLISHLVHINLMQIGVQVIYEGLADHRWTETQLGELTKELSGHNLAADFKFAMRGEAVIWVDMCDYFRKHPRELMTTLTGMGCFHAHYDSQEIGLRLIGYAIPPGWIYQNQLNATKSIVELVVPIANETNHVFYPKKCQEYEDGFNNRSLFSVFQYFKWMFTAGLGKDAQRYALAQEALNFSIIGIALERHRLATGEFPEKLAELVPRFLSQLPEDAIGGQSLKYRRDPDGGFILYSVGWNEVDDGGVVSLKESSWERLDVNKGDWVWRYPVKEEY